MADGDDLYLHFEVKIRNPTNKMSVALGFWKKIQKMHFFPEND
jgi:hypothetical protein